MPDTIFEIGGQDSKFISLEDGVVVDFAMNEACAAGTGSFLEEQAEKLGISIIGEFAELALSSDAPVKLGERCTVFMERDVNSYLQRGADKKALVAGLAYSIAYNYLNRLVGQRHIGDTIYFQGGTAYNDSVAAAFSMILDKDIIVPPYNGVVGAIGAALLAREKMSATEAPSRFRGWDLEKVDYSVREFVCKGCSNECDIRQFTIGDEKTYWGDKCSDRYRKRAKVDKEPVIRDLVEFRNALCFSYVAQTEDYEVLLRSGSNSPLGTIGIPRAMYTYDRLPFWATLFKACGFDVAVSRQTDKKVREWGIDASVAEPCFPIRVAHGHVAELLEAGVDKIFIPNQLNEETDHPELESHACPWGQTLPHVIKLAPRFEGMEDKFLAPIIHFRRGPEYVRDTLRAALKPLGVSSRTVDQAVKEAYEAQTDFRTRLIDAGAEAIATLEERDELGIVLVGRPYNIYDSGVNMDIPAKLRRFYGVNVIPLDFLPLWGTDTRDVTPNMFWNYGRKILQAARIVSEHPNLHIIYMTNFKCGPDSYVKHFIRDASPDPFLVLQFDEHTNDAGAMTRCEAYLDSKGFLRWWVRETRDSKRVTDSRSGSDDGRRRITQAQRGDRPAQEPGQRGRRAQGTHSLAHPDAVRRLLHAGGGLPLHRARRPGGPVRGCPRAGAGRQIHLRRRVLPAAHRAGRLPAPHRGRESRAREDGVPPPHRQRSLPVRPVLRAAAPGAWTSGASRTSSSCPSPPPTATPASASRPGLSSARRGGRW